MARTPPEFRRFLPRNGQVDFELFAANPDDWQDGDKKLWAQFQEWAPLLEKFIGKYELTNTPRNYVKNGDFRAWTGGVPDNWTVTNAPTLTQGDPRTGSFAGSSSCAIESGGSAGKISQAVRFQTSRIHEMSIWLKLDAADDVVVIRYVPAGGAANVSEVYTLAATDYGTDWFQIPGLKYDSLSIETASDHTTLTIEIEPAIGKKVHVSDVQHGPGVARNADVFVGAPEDSVTAQVYGEYTPTLTDVTNIQNKSSGPFLYYKIGNIGFASGQIQIDPNGVAATAIGISLPSGLESNFGAASDASGVGSPGDANGMVGKVIADAANDRVELQFQAFAATNQTWAIQFSWKII